MTVTEGSDVSLRLQFKQVATHTDTVTATADVKDSRSPESRPGAASAGSRGDPRRQPRTAGRAGFNSRPPHRDRFQRHQSAAVFRSRRGRRPRRAHRQFIQVGSFLLPNNLSANAHGNGYSDPNIMVPAIIESVQTDGGAFNVREGNHSVDLAATYCLRPSLEPFATLTGDYRDADLSAGWKLARSGGVVRQRLSGYTGTPPAIQVNAMKGWTLGAHTLTRCSSATTASRGFRAWFRSMFPTLHDTIDPRQRDQTHTGEIAVNDVWHLAPDSDLQLSGFFRTYNLSLYSNFGDGLIRQSEFRTGRRRQRQLHPERQSPSVLDGRHRLSSRSSASRRSGSLRSTDPAVYGPFEKVTANNITFNFLTRRSLRSTATSSPGCITTWAGGAIRSISKTTISSSRRILSTGGPASIRRKRHWRLCRRSSRGLPSVSLSFGESFFTNDPRMGTGTQQGSLISQAHSYQVVVSKTILAHRFSRHTRARDAVGRRSPRSTPIPDWQFDEGPGRNRYVTVSARHYFRFGLLQGSVSKADARDLSDGTPDTGSAASDRRRSGNA